MRLLEARVDAQESLMKFYNSGRKPTTLPDADDVSSTALTSEEGLRLKGFDHLLRSILTKLGMQSTDLRNSARDRERLLSSIESAIRRLDSTGETMRHVDRKVGALVKGDEGG